MEHRRLPLPDKPVKEAQELLPDLLISKIGRLLELVPEWPAMGTAWDETIYSMLVKHIYPVL